MPNLKQVLMQRDNLTSEEADHIIQEAREEFQALLEDGELPHDFMAEAFGLEPDYLMDFIG